MNFPVASGPQTYNLPPAGMPPHGPHQEVSVLLVPLELDYVVHITN